jgi:hypothetical protein
MDHRESNTFSSREQPLRVQPMTTRAHIPSLFVLDVAQAPDLAAETREIQRVGLWGS